MADHRLFDPNVPIRDFKAELDTCMMRGMCGRPFIRVAKLMKWLKSEASPGSRVSQVERLLYAAYHDRIELPISINQVCRSDNCSLLVFSILLELGLGGLFDRFQRQGIVDKQLPIDLRILKYRLEPLRLPNATQLAEDFDRKQWAYCAVKFDLYLGQDYPKNRIIPICSKEEINTKGGTARLWQIEVQEEFVGQQLREVVSTPSFNSPHDHFGLWVTLVKRYQFALKTFQEGNREFYENEREAFRALQNHEGMVRYLDDYGHKEIQRPPNTAYIVAREGQEDDLRTMTTYNILLEFGELDLDEYFACRQPPVLQVEVQAFWKDLFEVADAVKGIHNFEKLRAGVRQEYYGWHADIKPDNILIVQGKFKLADPGFARFEKKTDERKNTIVPGGTRTFGAPECDPGRGIQAPVPRTIDIWSLGCVFSIAATWVVLGYHGIQQFNNLRERAIERIIQKHRIEPRPGERAVPLTQGDYFHDGKEVLDDIQHWHNYLRSVLRRTDTITSQVLDLVDRKMLRGIAKDRVEAKDLCEELKDISIRGHTKPAQQLPESIMTALLEVDEKAPSQPVSPGVPRDTSRALAVADSQDRKARKSKLLDRPFMKTTHRSEYLKSELRAQCDATDAFEVVYESPTEESAPLSDRPSSHSSENRRHEYFPHIQPTHPSQKTKHQRPQSSPLHLPMPNTPISTHSNQHTAPKKNTRQTVFQARADIERRQKSDFFLRRTPRDVLLTRYFGNRDIKFLVDNAESMEDYWDEAIFLLETLVMKAKGQDEDGMDLSFTGGPIKIENKTKPSDFKKAMEDPKARPMEHTDITGPLGDIFLAYLRQARRSVVQRIQLKKLTLIILTDGIWDGTRNKDDVEEKIITFVKDLEGTIGTHQTRPVSIQFIQFGNNADATYRLRHLDDDLASLDARVPDIIDTEHSTGDVNKMLLGSFVEEYDQKDEGSLSPPGSPTNLFGPPVTPSRPMQPILHPDQTLRTNPPQMDSGLFRPPGTDQIQRSNSTTSQLLGAQRTSSFVYGKPSGYGFRERKYNQ